MPDVLSPLQEISSSDRARLDAEPAAAASRKGGRLGRQAQLPVAPGFEEISPVIAPLSKATACGGGEAPVLLLDPSDEDGDSVAAFWAY
ncbi:MAG TPA: hypothetical protein VKN76_13075 [Kiloniellaceae bacterium]|nr:hypothetical protein [Kiloniellaceae bacterium]